MKNLHLISGLPRSGSTLLCQILNMNPEFKATSTSPILDMLLSQQSVYSHNMSFKATDRMETYNNFVDAQKAFLSTFYSDDKVIFDKNRMWPSSLLILDEILDNMDTKIIWTYRSPKDIVSSLEARHRQTPVLQYIEDQQTRFSNLLETRISGWIGENGIVGLPCRALFDAINMGYEDRIFVVDYKDLCLKPQQTMDEVHKFLGIQTYKYSQNDFEDLKQTTVEHDLVYNYKYPHDITQGKIEYQEAKISLPKSMLSSIDQHFQWVISYCEEQIEKREKQTKTRSLKKVKK